MNRAPVYMLTWVSQHLNVKPYDDGGGDGDSRNAMTCKALVNSPLATYQCSIYTGWMPF